MGKLPSAMSCFTGVAQSLGLQSVGGAEAEGQAVLEEPFSPGSYVYVVVSAYGAPDPTDESITLKCGAIVRSPPESWIQTQTQCQPPLAVLHRTHNHKKVEVTVGEVEKKQIIGYRFVVKVGDKEGLGPAGFSRWRDLHKYIGKNLAEQGLPPLEIKGLSYNWFQRNEYKEEFQMERAGQVQLYLEQLFNSGNASACVHMLRCVASDSKAAQMNPQQTADIVLAVSNQVRQKALMSDLAAIAASPRRSNVTKTDSDACDVAL